MALANHFGGALLRLCAQWAKRKPARSLPRSIECFLRAGYTTDRARIEHDKDARLCDEWLARQKAVLMDALPETAEALGVLAELARRWQLHHPELVARAVLRHWMDGSCGHCDGHRQVEGKVCPICHGTGASLQPYGPAGTRLAAVLERHKSKAGRNLGRHVRARWKGARQYVR